MVVQSGHQTILYLDSVELTTINNSAAYPSLDNDSSVGGGAILTYDNTVISFDGINNFINNSVGQGGAVFTFLIVTHNIVLSFSGTSNFINNSAFGGGGAIYMLNSKLTFNGTVNFTNNACIGRVGVQLVEEYSYGTKMHLIHFTHPNLGGSYLC